MAYIRDLERKDGSIGFQVCWRVGGRNGTTKSETFEDPVMRGLFKAILEAQGEAQAQAWLDRQDPEQDARAVPTLDQYMAREIAHRTSTTEGTRHDYGNVYRRMWSTQPVEAMGGRALGGLPVDVITRDMLAAIILRHAQRRLKPKTIANARGLLASIFHAMVDDTDIPVTASPCKRLTIPVIARPVDQDGQEEEDDDDGEIMCLTHEEFQLVYDEIPEYWQPLVLFLVGTGLRWSEATALRTDRVDLAAGTIRITRAWQKVPGGFAMGPPKTKRSRRTVHLDPDQIDLLADLMSSRKRGGFVFLGPTSGKAVSRTSFYSSTWRPALWRAGLCDKHRAHECGHALRTPTDHKRCKTPPPQECGCPGTLLRRPRIHDLRHTHVAWLVDADAKLPWISRRLGHESIKTTWDIYGDVLPKLQEQSLETVTASMAPLRLKAPKLKVV